MEKKKLNPISIFGFYELLFNPSTYFAPGKTANSRLLQLLVIIPFSIMIVQGNMIKKWVTKFELKPDSPLRIIYTDWNYTWITLLGCGFIGAFIIFKVGVRWYQARLTWCGAENPDYEDAKFVFFFSSLAYTVPGLLVLIHQTEIMPNFMTVIYYQGLEYFAILVTFLVWSVHIQWVGVKSMFKIDGWKTYWWFFIMPLIAQLYYIHQFQVLMAFREYLMKYFDA